MNRRAITTFCAISTALFLLLIGILHSIVNVSGLRRAIERGEISPDCDVETLAVLAPAMAAFRVLVQKQPVDAEYLVSLIDGVLLPAARMGRVTP